MESEPPNSSPKWGDEPKGLDNEYNNPQSVKINKCKNNKNRNRTSLGSTPSGMTKFKGRTKDPKVCLFYLDPQESDMY